MSFSYDSISFSFWGFFLFLYVHIFQYYDLLACCISPCEVAVSGHIFQTYDLLACCIPHNVVAVSGHRYDYS